MAYLAHWTREQAAFFLGTSADDFDAIAERYFLRADRPGSYLASNVAGLAEELAAQACVTLPGWHGAFLRHGFAHLPGLIPIDLMSLLDRWARERLAAGTDQPGGAATMYGPTGALVRVNFLERDPQSMELIRRLPLQELACELVEDAVMYRLSIVVRSATVPPELGRHRDPRWSARRTCHPVFAFGLNLDSSRGESGDVYYSPGTHRIGDDGALPDANDPMLSEQTFCTERGDAVVHNLGVVHGARRYFVDRERITVYCSFASAREIALQPWGPDVT